MEEIVCMSRQRLYFPDNYMIQNDTTCTPLYNKLTTLSDIFFTPLCFVHFDATKFSFYYSGESQTAQTSCTNLQMGLGSSATQINGNVQLQM